MEDFESLNFGLDIKERLDPSLRKVISRRGRLSSQLQMKIAIKNFINEREDTEENYFNVLKKRKLTYEENNQILFNKRNNIR